MEKVLNKIYDWIDKIGKHNFMLIVFILIVTIVTGLYTTFSIMTSTGPSEFIDGLLTYKFILNADSDTNSVTIAAGSSKLLDITVSNEEDTKLQYGIYYSATEDINIGYVKNSTYPSTGLIEGKQNYIVTIKVDNNTNNDVTINFVLSFGLEKGGDLIIPDGSTIIGKYTEYGNAAKFIKSLYEDGSSINTVHIAGDTSKPQVHLNETQSIMLDNNGDYRYYGASPNNYIDFNGELWRIISVSNVKSSEEDTTGETRVRIIKDTSIGYYAWNTGGTNNWADAILMCQLNTMYYNDTVPACTGKSLTSLNTSLNTEAKSLIDNALWYLGGGDTSVLYADDHYSMERNNPGYGSNPTRWTGKVGIMYPSDYGYAADLSVCKVTGNNYDTDTTNCLNTDWLFNSEYQWLMSPYSGISNGAWYVDEAGFVSIGGGIDVDFENGVRPVAILKSDVAITGGKGTSDNPYKLLNKLNDNDNTTTGYLNEVSVGSYVDYTGSNGCTGELCNGQNANYEEGVTNGWCGSNSKKEFIYSGWRVAYIDENGSSYLISAGSPECICTNSDGTSSSESCDTYIETTTDTQLHLKNMNDIALKYCNTTYAYGGVCDNTTTWVIRGEDFTKITNSNFSDCIEVSSSECGLENELINNGGYYWFSDTNWEFFRIWGKDMLASQWTYSTYGVRPIIKLDENVTITGGKGTSVEPYTLGLSS